MMPDEVKRDLQESAYDFLHTVWPAISAYCQGGEICPVESVVDRGFISKLDEYSGIDAFQLISQSRVIRGIASRVQYVESPYTTFTLRYKRSSGSETEFEKRLYAIHHIDDGYMYPHLTVQAYMTKHQGELLLVGVTQTKPLYLYTEQYLHDRSRVFEKTNPDDGNKFLAVRWNPYKKIGNRLKIYHPPSRVEATA